ncbi:MBL fold metallo-hydrolase [Salipaludibacillus sp. CUR1]|uniref:MBL fold metallo-hydrolase n=1 Tax=Salipaludibacillus sp. CUR1 TaxID=2820003 RepID=UPI001E44CE4B|nr:MBL fold metallo-hydrolase [Salipaludibacillus sp. CUR1]MCE7791670.1 MBL fold metallo-hydrolase [Salipaludibacillus sp. CUR1]
MKTTMIQRSKEIYQMTIPTPFLVGPVNTYLIKGDALTLVDTGPKTAEAREQMENALAELNLSFKDIELVVLTHHHPDHIGMIGEFLPNAKIAGHLKLKPWLEKDEQFYSRTRQFFYRFYREHGVPESWVREMDRSQNYYMNFTTPASVDFILEEGDSIDGLPGWRVLETPGHAQSHLSLIKEKDGTMIAGDHLIEHISSNAIIEAPYFNETERPKTLLQYREALKKCKNASLIFSGHGRTIRKPKELIEERINAMDKKAQVFKRKMGEDPIQVFSLCQKMYPEIYRKQTALTFSETLGHLDLLEERGEVKAEMSEGEIYYMKA